MKASMGTEWFKFFGGGQKKVTRGMRLASLVSYRVLTSADPDGQPPKRRGPKPDSKPALTRRQELNRQAQRYVDNTDSAS